MAQKAFAQNVNECTGCRCCQMACKDKNDLPVGTFFRKVTDHEGGEFPDVWVGSLSMSCNHCDDPACVAACPQGALYKEDEFGLVLQDVEKCIACQTCVGACPYGAPKYIEELGVVRKCDGCIEWLKNGLQPACSGACSTRCLQFVDAEEVAGTEGYVRDIAVLPSSELTGSNFYINPKPQML